MRLLVLTNLRRVDVDVHDGRAGGERLELPGDAIVEANSKREEQIRRVDGVVGVHGSVHSEHVEAELVGGGVASQTHEGVGDGDAGGLDELLQLGRGVEAAAARVHHRSLGVFDHVQHALHLGMRRGRGEAAEVAVEGHLGSPVRDAHLLLDVLWDVDEHGAGATAGREEESLADDARDVVHVHDEVVVLGDLAGDLDGGRLLERVGADHAPGNLSGDGHHRHGVEEGVGEAGDEVRGTRPRRRDAHPDFACALGVPLRGENLALLVPAQHVPHARLGLCQRLVDLHGRAAGVGEHAVDALALQSLDEDVRPFSRFVVAEARLKVGDGPLRREVLHLRGGQLRLGEHGGIHAGLFQRR